MKDFRGVELQEGIDVVHHSGGRNSCISNARVMGFTLKMVRIRYVYHSGGVDENLGAETCVYSENLIVPVGVEL